MIISPQSGQRNFVASVAGAMILWHDVHVGMAVVVCSVTVVSSWNARYRVWFFICTVFFVCACISCVLANWKPK